MSDENPRKPNEVRSFDRVQAAIWRNEDPSGDPRKVYWTFSFSCSFKDKSGEWKNSKTFTERDLPQLGLAIQWALNQMVNKPQ